MKTKKIVIGAMAAAMLSLSVCSLAPVAAADETVQISVGKTTAQAGGEFSVDVSLADIPSTGIQCCNFAIKYDSSVLEVTDVKAGTLAGSVSGDSSASLLPNFNNYGNEGFASVMWSTSVDNTSSWIKGEGTFCTVTGKVSSTAKDGTVAAISVVPIDRETFYGSGEQNAVIDCGYTKEDGSGVSYKVNSVAGSVTVGSGKTIVRGDANDSGDCTVADAVAILQYVANKEKYPLSADGKLAADVDGISGISANDALYIQKCDAKVIKDLMNA